MAHKCSCGSDSCGEKEIKVYFCPKCNSTEVKYVFGLGNAFGIIPKQKCSSCGLEAPAFPILVTTKSALDKAVKKVKKNFSNKSLNKKKKGVKKKR